MSANPKLSVLKVSRLLGGALRVGPQSLAEVFIALLCGLNTPRDDDDLEGEKQ